MEYTFQKPAQFREGEDHAGIVHEWLTSRGIVVHGVSITTDSVIIEADSDPTQFIKNYAPPVTARQKAKAALDELNGINLDTADVAGLRRALKLMRGLINYDARFD